GGEPAPDRLSHVGLLPCLGFLTILTGYCVRVTKPAIRRDDLVLGAIVGLVIWLATVFIHVGAFRLSDLKAYALIFVGAAALAVRRRFPVTAVVVAGVSTAYYYVGPFPEGPEMLTFALASYLAAANGQRLAAYLGTATGLAVFVVADLVIGPPIIVH